MMTSPLAVSTRSCSMPTRRRFRCSAGWKERTELYQLYPMLVHLNLFGTGYLGLGGQHREGAISDHGTRRQRVPKSGRLMAGVTLALPTHKNPSDLLFL